MATLTTPVRPKSSTSIRETAGTRTTFGKQPVAVPAQGAVAVATPAHRAGILTIMARLMLAFYDWLSGPPMTQRSRDQRELADARNILKAIRPGR